MRDGIPRRDFLKGGLAAVPALLVGAHYARGASVKRPLQPVDLKFISAKMTLMPRSEWTDVKAKTWLLREAGAYDRVTLHHTGKVVASERQKNAVSCLKAW